MSDKKQRFFDSDAELALLGALLIDSDILDDLDIVREDFYITRHGLIFEAMRDTAAAVGRVDFMTLAETLTADGNLDRVGGRAFLASLPTSTPSALNAHSYAGIVKRLSWLRRMVGLATRIVQDAHSGKRPDLLFAEIQDELAKMTPRQNSGSLVMGPDTIALTEEIIEQAMEDARTGEIDRWRWPRAWRSWNKHIRPMRPGQLAIIAAPDGVGKSTVLSNIAENYAMRGNQVVLVHLEDDHAYKLNRRLARWSGVELARIEDGDLTTDEFGRIDTANRSIAKWAGNLHYLHAPGWTMAQITKELQRLHDSGFCDVVILDYLDKVQASARQIKQFGAAVYERQGADVEHLKSWLESNGVPGITATQGNKAMQGSGIRTRRDIDGSGKKSQKAQLVIILTRQQLEQKMTLDNGVQLEIGDYSPFLTVRVDKQNRGGTPTLTQYFDGPRFRVVDLDMKKID